MDASNLNLSIAVFDNKGKGHAWRWRIVSAQRGLTKSLLKEINYQLKQGRKFVVRELKDTA